MPLKLTIQSGPNLGQVFTIQQGAQVIGRSSNSNITLLEPSVSEQHAKIMALPDGFVIEDLGSQQGTFVNGDRVTGLNRLHSGDMLQVGDVVIFSLQFSPSTQPQASWPWFEIAGIILVFIIGIVAVGLYFYSNVSISPPVQASAFTPISTATSIALAAPPLVSIPPTSSPSPAPTSLPSTPTNTPTLVRSTLTDTLAGIPPSSTATPIPTLPAVPASPTSTPTLSPIPASPTAIPPLTAVPVSPKPIQIEVSAPWSVQYDGVSFIWNWEGQGMLGDTDWYFDIKIFHNMFSEYPYDVIVAEHQNTRHVDGRWYYDIRPNFLCGAHWAVQIAQRAPDGSYAGPLSPESNRLATEFDGCGKRGGGEEPGGNTDNTMNP